MIWKPHLTATNYFSDTLSEVSIDDYDALIVPGGAVGADTLRGAEEAVVFVRGFFEQAKPAGVICHAPWLLVEADVVLTGPRCLYQSQRESLYGF